jgi:hypothetical protein
MPTPPDQNIPLIVYRPLRRLREDSRLNEPATGHQPPASPGSAPQWSVSEIKAHWQATDRGKGILNRRVVLVSCMPFLLSLLGALTMAETERPASGTAAARVAQAAAVRLHCAPEHLAVEGVPTRFFRSWTLWRADDGNRPPTAVFVATDAERTVPIDFDSGLAPLVSSEPVRLAEAEDAIEYTIAFLSMAKPLAFVLRSADDIPFLDKALRAKWGDIVRPPRTSGDENQRVVETWLFEAGNLLHAHFAIDSRGAIRPQIETVARGVGLDIATE